MYSLIKIYYFYKDDILLNKSIVCIFSKEKISKKQ